MTLSKEERVKRRCAMAKAMIGAMWNFSSDEKLSKEYIEDHVEAMALIVAGIATMDVRRENWGKFLQSFTESVQEVFDIHEQRLAKENNRDGTR